MNTIRMTGLMILISVFAAGQAAWSADSGSVIGFLSSMAAIVNFFMQNTPKAQPKYAQVCQGALAASICGDATPHSCAAEKIRVTSQRTAVPPCRGWPSRPIGIIC